MDRTCARCKGIKQADDFYANKPSWCKECIRAYMRSRRAPKREQFPPGFKRCARCAVVQPRTRFRRRRLSGYYAYCLDCTRTANREDEDKQRRSAGAVKRGSLGSKWANWRTSGIRRCPSCRIDLPLAAFRWDKTPGKPYGYCRKCSYKRHAVWLKTAGGRQSVQRYSAKPERRQKNAARRMAQAARQLGILVPQLCEVCGVNDVVIHHDDYTKPLQVRWLCSSHHQELHNRLEKEN